MASNPYINKVVYGQNTLIDLTADTATQADVAQGKYFHLPTGERVQGTASGGGTGSITQDQDGYLVLSPDGGGDGGGLEYEEGTWTPSSNTTDAWIPFSDTHTTAPCMYEIADATGTYDSTTYTNYRVSYTNLEQLFGDGLHQSTTQTNYGYSHCVRRSTGSTSFSVYNTLITSRISETADTQVTYPRYWAKETGIRATSTNADYYWRAGRTYKWIAVWAPTT